MKRIAITFLLFFVGLTLSLFIGDMIVAVQGCLSSQSVAFSINKAQGLAANENYQEAQIHLQKALEKIKPSDKKLLAKTQFNLAICKFNIAKQNNDKKIMQEALPIFLKSLEIYKELNDVKNIENVLNAINEAKDFLKNKRSKN